MIEKNPANRKSAEIYLSQARGNIFPEYFYSFLQSYMQIFSAAPILSPDEKISRLKKDIGNVTSMFINKAKESEESHESQDSKEPPKENEFTKENSGQSEEKKEEKSQTKETEESTEKVVDESLSKIEVDIQEAPKLDALDSIIESAENKANDKKDTEDPETTDGKEGLVIITQLVTSCIRGLHHSQSKLQSLEILLELAENTSDETILDRILPYIVSIF